MTKKININDSAGAFAAFVESITEQKFTVSLCFDYELMAARDELLAKLENFGGELSGTEAAEKAELEAAVEKNKAAIEAESYELELVVPAEGTMLTIQSLYDTSDDADNAPWYLALVAAAMKRDVAEVEAFRDRIPRPTWARLWSEVAIKVAGSDSSVDF